jgi:hypothetical protein
MLGCNIGRHTKYTDPVFGSFTQSLQTNAGIEPELYHGRFLLHTFQLIYLSKGILVRHTSLIESELKAPCSHIGRSL